jgi:hypothetical protein
MVYSFDRKQVSKIIQKERRETRALIPERDRHLSGQQYYSRRLYLDMSSFPSHQHRGLSSHTEKPSLPPRSSSPSFLKK